MAFEKKELKKKSDNISDWYNDVILKAEVADYGPARGTMVIRPYGYAIWEKVQELFNGMIKKAGVENAYFPMFIPMSLFEKEKEHIKGFSPELAVVTIGGGETLADPLVVRPTSETIMYSMYAKWIHSWRDLPLCINQWNNCVRWEKRTYLFLRTTEFLWQEGHTAHATEPEAVTMVTSALDWYRQIYEDYFAIPVLLGEKSSTEKFAGGKATYAIEALMPDGKALQAATSHNLGQNFSKVFDIQFQDKEGKQEYVWQTSWGLSTRSLGGLFLTHGDDSGLIMPPNIAPVQVVIIPIVKSDEEKSELLAYCTLVKETLEQQSIRVRLDTRDSITPGRKFHEWEVKGVPARVEIGMQEVGGKTLTVVERDMGEKKSIALDAFVSSVSSMLSDMQKRLFEKQKIFLAEHTHDVSTWDKFTTIMKTSRGFIRAFWCEDAGCEANIKEKTKASTRCLPLGTKEEQGVCVHCGKPAVHRWIFGQSY